MNFPDPLLFLYFYGAFSAGQVVQAKGPTCFTYNMARGIQESKCSCTVGDLSVKCTGKFYSPSIQKTQTVYFKVPFDTPDFQTSVNRMEGGSIITLKTDDSMRQKEIDQRASSLAKKKGAEEAAKNDMGKLHQHNLKREFSDMTRMQEKRQPFPPCQKKNDPKLKGKICSSGKCKKIKPEENFETPKNPKDTNNIECDTSCIQTSDLKLENPTCKPNNSVALVYNENINLFLGDTLILTGLSCDESDENVPKTWTFKNHKILLNNTEKYMTSISNNKGKLMIKNLARAEIKKNICYRWGYNMEKQNVYCPYKDITVITYFSGDTCFTYGGFETFKLAAYDFLYSNLGTSDTIIYIAGSFGGVFIVGGCIVVVRWYKRTEEKSSSHFAPIQQTLDDKTLELRETLQHQAIINDLDENNKQTDKNKKGRRNNKYRWNK